MPSKLQTQLAEQLTEKGVQTLAKALQTAPAKEIADALLASAAVRSVDELGYVVLPLLRARLLTDDGLFDELTQALATRCPAISLGVPLLEALAGAQRRSKATRRRETLATRLRELSEQPRAPIALRAQATRSLVRFYDKATQRTLARALGSQDEVLQTAAAWVVGRWTQRRRASGELLDGLCAAVENAPSLLLRSGVLRALALAATIGGSRRAGAQLERLAAPKFLTTEQRDMALCVAGALLPVRIVAALIGDLAARPTDAGVRAVSSLVQQRSSLPLELAAAHSALPCLLSIASSGSAPTRDALDALEHISSELEPRFRGYRVALEQRWRAAVKGSVRTASVPAGGGGSGGQVTGAGYATGFQVADAIYKELGGALSLLSEHWHAGLVCGFRPSVMSTNFLLEGVEVAGFGLSGGALGGIWSRLDNAVQTFAACNDFSDRSLDLRLAVEALRSKFLELFGCSEDVAFCGARSLPMLSGSKRAEVRDTALSLVGREMHWTFDDQLEWEDEQWDGREDDIVGMRCDGLVEYCYERGGLRVCDGAQELFWNISVGSNLNAENHNRFHGLLPGTCPGHYSQGDLCPRIQAGDVGTDSALSVPAAKQPILSTTASRHVRGVRLQLSVSASASNCAFVRVLVRSAGSAERWFLRVDDDVWCMRRVELSAWQPELVDIVWTGQTAIRPAQSMTFGAFSAQLSPTVTGPDFSQHPGRYTLIAQCIDEGGNVSDELSSELDVVWPAQTIPLPPFLRRFAVLQSHSPAEPVGFMGLSGLVPNGETVRYQACWSELTGGRRKREVSHNQPLVRRHLTHCFAELEASSPINADATALTILTTAASGDVHEFKVPISARDGGAYYYGVLEPGTLPRTQDRVDFLFESRDTANRPGTLAPSGYALDTDPSTVAIQQSSSPVGYMLDGYEPGIDRMHQAWMEPDPYVAQLPPDYLEANDTFSTATDVRLTLPPKADRPQAEGVRQVSVHFSDLSLSSLTDADYFHVYISGDPGAHTGPSLPLSVGLGDVLRLHGTWRPSEVSVSLRPRADCETNIEVYRVDQTLFGSYPMRNGCAISSPSATLGDSLFVVIRNANALVQGAFTYQASFTYAACHMTLSFELPGGPTNLPPLGAAARRALDRLYHALDLPRPEGPLSEVHELDPGRFFAGCASTLASTAFVEDLASAGEPQAATVTARRLSELGRIARSLGRVEDASQLYRASANVFGRTGDLARAQESMAKLRSLGE